MIEISKSNVSQVLKLILSMLLFSILDQSFIHKISHVLAVGFHNVDSSSIPLWLPGKFLLPPAGIPCHPCNVPTPKSGWRCHHHVPPELGNAPQKRQTAGRGNGCRGRDPWNPSFWRSGACRLAENQKGGRSFFMTSMAARLPKVLPPILQKNGNWHDNGCYCNEFWGWSLIFADASNSWGILRRIPLHKLMCLGVRTKPLPSDDAGYRETAAAAPSISRLRFSPKSCLNNGAMNGWL